jgi:hypothetical protein
MHYVTPSILKQTLLSWGKSCFIAANYTAFPWEGNACAGNFQGERGHCCWSALPSARLALRHRFAVDSHCARRVARPQCGTGDGAAHRSGAIAGR